jgi:crotonobetainyl-CoA:carnitine CoA-transferase CaiB-like acyl-CoA transferase
MVEMEDTDDALPFSGIRVIDATQGVAGPHCGNILRLYGADVVKVEPPHGDWGRPLGAGVPGATAISIANSFGKRALCLDAQQPAARAALLRLAQSCDVFLESFRPGVIARLGAPYEAVAEKNPGVIYASVTGFGQTGPYIAKPATDAVVQALSGMMVMNKDAAGTPRRIGMYAVDTMTGMYAAQAVMAALFGRGRSGNGKRLDISLLNAAAAFQAVPLMDHAINAAINQGAPPVPPVVPSGTFPTSDGYLNLAALTTDMFFRIATAIGHDEWKDDPRYATNETRAAIAADVNATVAAILKTNSTAHWVEKFEKADSLCASVLDYATFKAHPQTGHAGFMHSIAQPGLGELPIAALPGMRNKTRYQPLAAIGAHTREILADYGFSENEIAALIDSGAAIQS